MGLGIICSNLTKSIGSYNEVGLLKKDLIDSTIKLLKIDEVQDENTLRCINYLKDFISDKGIIYSNFSIDINNILSLYNLNGIITFIMKTENNNVMSPGESVDFMCSIDKLKKYISKKYFVNNIKSAENFYLSKIFMLSIKNFICVEFF
tara:strand:+ start:3405 stop:3851 length:447 start_codon:yes stop_codon:yes gene_type:complete